MSKPEVKTCSWCDNELIDPDPHETMHEDCSDSYNYQFNDRYYDNYEEEMDPDEKALVEAVTEVEW